MKTLKGDATRPTSDRVKESLFNIIAPYIPEANVLDAYAGTGSLGIEALSRGANSVVFTDRSQECFSIIKENLKHTKLEERAEVYSGEVLYLLESFGNAHRKFDLIFLDPPYHKNLIEVTLNCIIKNDIISKDGIIVAERDAKDSVPEEIGNIGLFRNQKYGDTVLSFYKYKE